MALGNEETIDYQIRIEAVNALKSLEEITSTASGLPEVIKAVETQVQLLADKFGISFGAAQKEFQDTIAKAEQLRSVMAEVQAADAGDLVTFSPFLQTVANAQSPFGQMGEAVGWKALTDARREAAILSKDEAKSEAAVAKELNAQTVAQEKLAAQEAKRIAASQTLEALTKKQLEEMQAMGRLNLIGSNNDKINQLKGVISEVSKATGSQYGDIANQLEKMGVPAAQANAAVKGLNNELTKGSREAQGFTHNIDAVRTALGTFVAIGIFTALQAITGFFKGAIDQARQFEETLYRIQNAERQLSEAGIDVSVKQLKKGIDEIQKALPIFSKEDVSQMIGGLATATKELGLTGDELTKLGAAVAILNINSTETESLLQTQGQVAGALLSPQARTVKNLGLAFSKLKMEAVGAQLGIKKTLEEMTDAEKTKVKLQIIFETAGIDNIDSIAQLREEIQKGGGDFEALNEYLNSNTARLAANGAAWKDLQTTVGQVFLPLLPGLTKFIDVMTSGFNGLKVVIIEASAGFMGLVEAIRAFTSLPVTATFKEMGDAFKNGMTKGIDETRKELVNKFFPGGIPESAGAGFKKLYEPLINPPRETATNPAQLYKDAGALALDAVQKSEEKITQVMQDAADKRADIERQYSQKLADIALDNQRKLEDITRDTAQKREDAMRNYGQKVEDINRNANEKIAEAQADARQKEIDREKEFQERLRELREKFLFDLEDALHERDARQILRLMRQYQMDKKTLEEKHKLDAGQSKKDLAQKLADIERERQLKLQAAAREYQEKLAEIQRWEARERADAALALSRKLADARIWHQRELQDYQRYLQQKLQALAQSIVKEYQLTAAGAAAIYNLLNGYYGANGSIPGLLNQGLTNSLNSIVSGASGGSTPTVSPTWHNAGFFGAAEGGTFIATRPTKMLVGEKGMEKVSVTPLSRSGSDVNKIFTNAGAGGSSMGGSLALKVSLTDGLVAEIIETSLDNVAATIERIRREK